MKSKTLIYGLMGIFVIVTGFLWLYFSAESRADLPFFDATVNRDCAPWDGAAFTISIPYDPGTIIYISIWQSPEINFPVTFTLPDQTGRVGNAAFLLRYSYSVQLTGKVLFRRVEQGTPVEGKFDLVTKAGQRLTGRFEAEWGNEIVYCG